MNPYTVMKWIVYLLTFGISMYATSSIQFDKICHIREPRKVQVLWLFVSIGLAYVVAEFIFALTIYNQVF